MYVAREENISSLAIGKVPLVGLSVTLTKMEMVCFSRNLHPLTIYVKFDKKKPSNEYNKTLVFRSYEVQESSNNLYS